MTGGTLLTYRLCQRHGKPVLVVDLAEPYDPARLRQWIQRHAMGVLNVAGPRESTQPGIYAQAAEALRRILSERPPCDTEPERT